VLTTIVAVFAFCFVFERVIPGWKYNRHKNNYGDITWWDMLFGTYENPKDWIHTCGFDDAKEQQLIRMLTCKDVNDGA